MSAMQDQKLKLKVAHFVGPIKVGGAQNVALSLTELFDVQLGMTSTLLTTQGSDAKLLAGAAKKMSVQCYKNRKALLEAVPHLGLDALIIHNYWSTKDVEALCALGRRAQFKTIIVYHNYFARTVGQSIAQSSVNYAELGIYAHIFSIYSQADAVVTLTEGNAIFFGLGLSQVLTIGNPVSLPQQVETHNKDYADPHVLCVGRMNSPVKRLDRILKLFSELLKRVPNASLDVIGPYNLNITCGPAKERPKQILASMGELAKKVHFHGVVYDVTPFYEKSCALILASEFEGFPLVLTEAAGFSLPVITSEFAGVSDIVIDGETGYVIAGDDFENGVEKLAGLINSPEKAVRFGQQARVHMARFSEKVIGEKWKTLLDYLCYGIGAPPWINQERNDAYQSLRILEKTLRDFSLVVLSSQPKWSSLYLWARHKAGLVKRAIKGLKVNKA